MKKMTGKNTMPKLVLIMFALSAAAVFAAQNETVGRALSILRPEVKVQISGTLKRGSQIVALDKTEMVESGEILDWKISSANLGSAAARNYRVVGQIPKGTEYIAGSADGDHAPQILYSIDGGKSFSMQPVVEEKQPDGSVKQIPAPVSMYSQIKFEWAKELPAESQLNAAYRVRVK